MSEDRKEATSEQKNDISLESKQPTEELSPKELEQMAGGATGSGPIYGPITTGKHIPDVKITV